MDFIQFARSHGIIINELPPVGVLKRYRTEDHPKKKNGSVKYMGTHGFVQNHALSTVTALWKPDSVNGQPSDMRAIIVSQAKAEQARKRLATQAVSKAVAMLNDSGYATHPYLVRKGFPDETGNVLMVEGKPVLLIPMRVGKSLVGIQQIWPEGDKRFLYGQRTAGATFTFDNKGLNIVCEGYATALSVRAAMKQMKHRYTIHVCFSAGNMVKVAAGLESGLVIADNDKSGTGQQAAAEIGWPVWMSDREGEDANDAMKRLGLFAFSQSLTQSMLNISAGGHYERQSTV
jgi:putative DNA primase/helicase